jgi:hypothetical protein
MCDDVHFNNILCIFVEVVYNPKFGAARLSLSLLLFSSLSLSSLSLSPSLSSHLLLHRIFVEYGDPDPTGTTLSCLLMHVITKPKVNKYGAKQVSTEVWHITYLRLKFAWDAYVMGLPTFLWQTAKTVIVGWFPGRTWEVTVLGSTNRLNYCIIFVLYTQVTYIYGRELRSTT